MKRLLTALIASAALLVFATPAYAQSSAMAHATKAPKMSNMSHASMSKSSSMATTAVKCPAGQTMVKGYKKKDGTVVKAYCRKSK
jgi:hypothetical protein